jgi:hypothetical protein
MAFAIETSDGKYLSIVRHLDYGKSKVAMGERDRLRDSNRDILDIRIQNDPINKTNNATYVSEEDAELDMQDAIAYIRSMLNRFKQTLAELEEEGSKLRGEEESALRSVGRLRSKAPGDDLEGFMSRAGKLGKKLSRIRSALSSNQSDAATMLRRARMWRKVIAGLRVVEV